MQHVVSVGGGFTSTLYTPERVIREHGPENVTLLMARLPNEDPDVWRLCEAVEREFGVPVTYIGRDKTPWDVFFAERMMGNSRVDPCSRILKRQVLRDYMRDHFDPGNTLLHVGITFDELHRMKDIQRNWSEIGYRIEAPLLKGFFMTRAEMMVDCERAGSVSCHVSTATVSTITIAAARVSRQEYESGRVCCGICPMSTTCGNEAKTRSKLRLTQRQRYSASTGANVCGDCRCASSANAVGSGGLAVSPDYHLSCCRG